MILAIIRAMALSLIRDRGALAMNFALPPLLFLVFAAVFAGAGGGTAHLKVALAQENASPGADAFVAALSQASDLSVTRMSPDEVAPRVAHGLADAGLIVKGDPSAAEADAPLLLVVDPGNATAGSILVARVHRLFGETLPALAIRRTAGQIAVLTGPFTQEQKEKLEASIAKAGELVAEGGAELFARQETEGHAGQSGVSYYAGAIAILFLLFSAVQGAASLLDERRSGVFDRIAMTSGGLGALVSGKLLFLIGQGLAQSAVLFTVASLVYGVAVLPHFGPWLAVSLAASAAAAGFALALAAASRTRQQAQTISTFAVLMLSAIGGSMVPRFLMPQWLQSLGWLTPTAWAIEGYQGALWRGDGWAALVPALAVLLAYGLGGTLIAAWLVRRIARRR